MDTQWRLLGVCVLCLCAAWFAAAEVTFESNTPEVVDGVQYQRVTIEASSLDGKSVYDNSRIVNQLTNGAEMPVKVEFEPPVMIYDVTPAGYIPERTMLMTIPMCDTPINPFTGEDSLTEPEARRLRLAAAAMGLHGHRRLESTMFHHWTPEHWDAYASGRAALTELGISPSDATKLHRNLTIISHLNMIKRAVKTRHHTAGLSALLHDDGFLFPPFMRDVNGKVTEEYMEKVYASTLSKMSDAFLNHTHLDEQGRRRLLPGTGVVALGVASAALGMAAYATHMINEEILPALDSMADAMEAQAKLNEENADAIAANAEFANSTRRMLNKTTQIVSQQGIAIEGLQKITGENSKQIEENLLLIEANERAANKSFNEAFNGRESNRNLILELTQATDLVVADMGEAVNGLRDYTKNSILELGNSIRDIDDRFTMLTINTGHAIDKVLSRVDEGLMTLHNMRTKAAVRRDLTGVFYALSQPMVSLGWKPFLWQNTGNPIDPMYTGIPPQPEGWTDGNPGRRVQMDRLVIVTVENANEEVDSIDTYELQDYDMNVVCDGKQMMNNIASWSSLDSIRRLFGPDKCMPIPTGTFPGAPNRAPDPEAGEWVTDEFGGKKYNTGGALLKPCKCWIEIKARSCTHGVDNGYINPLSGNIDPELDVGMAGLTSPLLCTGAGSSGPVEATSLYNSMATESGGDIQIYTMEEVLGTTLDPSMAWFNPQQRYIFDWASFLSVLEWICGHERFLPFSGSPLTQPGFRRVKFFDRQEPYALVASERMSNLYTTGEEGGDDPDFMQPVYPFADDGDCEKHNTNGDRCAAMPGRSLCMSCHRCGATPMALTLSSNKAKGPASLPAVVFNLLQNGVKAMRLELRDLDIVKYGILPADVYQETKEFRYSPETRTSFTCNMLTLVYTIGGYTPLNRIRLRETQKRASIRIDKWGNGQEDDPDTWPMAANGQPGMSGPSIVETSSRPTLAYDSNIFLDASMLIPGPMDCILNECDTPAVFLDADGRPMPSARSRYTYNVPDREVSASEDAVGRANSVSYIMVNEVGVDGITLNQWKSEYGDVFNPIDASASLHHYYVPLEKLDNDGDIQCAVSQGASAGPWCSILSNFRIFDPVSANGVWGDDVTNACGRSDTLCLTPKAFTLRESFRIPQGTPTSVVVTACPTLDTSPVDQGFPKIYLSHTLANPVSARVVMENGGDNDQCIPQTLDVTVQPGRPEGVNVQVCGEMSIKILRFNAATSLWDECGDPTTTDVQPPPQFQGDDGNFSYVIQQPMTVINNLDDARVVEVGQAQADISAESRALWAAVLPVVFESNPGIVPELEEAAGFVLNKTRFNGIYDKLHENSETDAANEKARASAAETRIQNIVQQRVSFVATVNALLAELNNTIIALKENIKELKEENKNNAHQFELLWNESAQATAQANETNAIIYKAVDDIRSIKASSAFEIGEGMFDGIGGIFGGLLSGLAGIFGDGLAFIFTILIVLAVCGVAACGLCYVCRGPISKFGINAVTGGFGGEAMTLLQRARDLQSAQYTPEASPAPAVPRRRGQLARAVANVASAASGEASKLLRPSNNEDDAI